PYLDVVIDGDAFSMRLDIGATIWLTEAALGQMQDGKPSERATSILAAWEFDRLRSRHRDWRVIERADRLTLEPIIEVPRVSIAGFEIGPVWFRSSEYIVMEVTAQSPAFLRRFGGSIGGSVLREFVITLDYPRGVAEFVRPLRR
ncbi:MAG: hypothetical protein ACREMA_14310, partial [Longimicrobiales bacterium]